VGRGEWEWEWGWEGLWEWGWESAAPPTLPGSQQVVQLRRHCCASRLGAVP